MSGFFDRLLSQVGLARGRVVRGVRVQLDNTRADIRDEEVLARLDEALALVATYAPQRWRHLQRDVRGIRVERFPTRGAFLPDERVILTELTFLARRDISAAPVASSILHEGVHARVHAWRVRLAGGPPLIAPTPNDADRDRAREERLCRRAELAFGRALPPELGAPVVERALASLAMADHDVAPAIDWRVARARQDAADRDAADRDAADRDGQGQGA
ncbi:MAG: hypothetical protein LCH84_18960 [Gemmatimonadetes bacterium]|nr:hypothetical protein [Gemmatimonadota bacterium]